MGKKKQVRQAIQGNDVLYHRPAWALAMLERYYVHHPRSEDDHFSCHDIFSYFNDSSLEWTSWSCNPLLLGRGDPANNSTLPLAFMVRKAMIDAMDWFLQAAPHANVRDPCYCRDGILYTPLQWAVARASLTIFSACVFWRAGLSVSEIMRATREDAQRYTSLERELSICKQMEESMVALAWCCEQITGTLWRDTTATVVPRLRLCPDLWELINESMMLGCD